MQRGPDLGDALAEVDVLLQKDPLDPHGARVVAVLKLVEKRIGNAKIANVGQQLAEAKEAIATPADFLDSQRDAGEFDHASAPENWGTDPRAVRPRGFKKKKHPMCGTHEVLV